MYASPTPKSLHNFGKKLHHSHIFERIAAFIFEILKMGGGGPVFFLN